MPLIYDRSQTLEGSTRGHAVNAIEVRHPATENIGGSTVKFRLPLQHAGSNPRPVRRTLNGTRKGARAAGARRRRALLLVFVTLCAIAASGCTLSPSRRMHDAGPIDSFDRPVGSIVIVVDKSARVLSVFRKGRLEQSYSVVLGRQPLGRKRYEGDMRTPEGSYRITAKRRHQRWQYFLALDYPSDQDVHYYKAEVASGSIPAIDGSIVGIGGGLGIHGNDRPPEQRMGIDWTHGCVAMRAEDIEELFVLVDVDTPVILLP